LQHFKIVDKKADSATGNDAIDCLIKVCQLDFIMVFPRCRGVLTSVKERGTVRAKHQTPE